VIHIISSDRSTNPDSEVELGWLIVQPCLSRKELKNSRTGAYLLLLDFVSGRTIKDHHHHFRHLSFPPNPPRNPWLW
jgi:hypothetical protein